MPHLIYRSPELAQRIVELRELIENGETPPQVDPSRAFAFSRIGIDEAPEAGSVET